MLLENFSYTRPTGWSVRTFPELDSARTLVLVFGAAGVSEAPEALQALVTAYPRARVLGCSTAGEILDDAIRDDSLSVAVAKFASTDLRTASARVASTADSFGAGVSLARDLLGPGLRGVFILSDGLQVNGSELVRGINTVLPESVVVTGGLAGDGPRFQRTWVLADGRATTGVVAAVGLYGPDVQIGHGSKGGWDIFGPERRVTRSEGNVLYELDGKPALALYKSYLGDRAEGLPATALLFPLQLRPLSGEQRALVRTIVAVDEAAQSLTFVGDIPQGARAQLMQANFDRLIEGAAGAAESCLRRPARGPTLSIAVSCVGRRLVLGARAEEEVEAALEVLPPGTKQVGFYSYGEISPYTTGPCDLHNQTMTLTTISEAGVA